MPSISTRDDLPDSKRDADLVRLLAEQGALAERMADATGAERRRLTGGAFAIAGPIVFERLTRRIEFRRGHPQCASSPRRLEPDCLDRFHDDVESVLEDLFDHARTPIHNLEGWISSRLNAATVDGHRRRRGERGALQKPRLPKWLIRELGLDPWLHALALEVLVWVGIPATAGTDVWPWQAWAERRSRSCGDARGPDAALAKDLNTVLTAMRRNRTWYEKYVERPLGRKQAPLASVDAGEADRPRHDLALTARHESDDAELLELASLAREAILRRIGDGEDPRTVVIEVVAAMLGTGLGALDLAPGTAVAQDEWLAAVLANQDATDRMVARILAVVARP